ncbi:hypothetical protein JCM16303_006820 [Sporobolomyces ruberrimus]
MNAFTTSLRTTLRGVTARPAFNALPPSTRFFSSSPFPSSSSSPLDDVLNQVKQDKQQQQQPQKKPRGQQGTRQSIYPSELYSGSSSTRTSFSSPLSTPSSPEEIWRYQQPVAYSPSVTTTSARSFAVQSGNLARAYRNLNRVLNENNVRRELKRQERFESPSNKRVRLNSERHRKRFKVAVGKAVSLAMRMKDL